MLTVREYGLACKLLTVNRTMKIKEISELFNVSERTVKYDLNNVKNFFTSINIPLISQPNKGIWIECSEEEKNRGLRLLAKVQSESLYYNQETRVQKIFFILFSSKRYYTANELADELGVTRNTIFNDLDYIDIILNNSDIYLIRRSGKGFQLGGPERKLRQFLESLIQKSLSVYDIYLVTESVKSDDINGSKIGFPDYLNITYLESLSVLKKYYKSKPEIFLNCNYMLFVIRLLISIHRTALGAHLEGGTMEFPCGPIESLYMELCKKSKIEPSFKEMEYIGGFSDSGTGDIDIPELVSSLISYISMKSGIHYNDDTTLYSRLLSHLTLSLKESTGDIKENPFNSLIINNHTMLFETIREVCLRHIPNILLSGNDSFISYIALHFLISQRNLAKKKKFKAILVCATGRGAARIISRMIEAEIKELHFLTSCSLIEVESEAERLKPDYIISVFPVKSTIPVIIVEPIPTKENLKFIQTLIDERLDKDILDENEFSSILRFSDGDKNVEEMTQEIIITGLSIYDRILNSGKFSLKKGMEFAFMTHVMLLANRCHFNTQYLCLNEEESKDIREIFDIFTALGITLSSGEAEALLNFFTSEECV